MFGLDFPLQLVATRYRYRNPIPEKKTARRSAFVSAVGLDSKMRSNLTLLDRGTHRFSCYTLKLVGPRQSRWIIFSSSQHLAVGLRYPHMDEYNDIGVAFAFVAHGINACEPVLKSLQGSRH
ncbi:hypothetical protein DL93DRAFT_2090280, partial [Clavulina sp. PMI_390]